ncbi:MAG: YdeI/OmpD-associated family protein [Thermomicrobiales bacterium]
MPLENAIEIAEASQFDDWLARHGRDQSECWVIMYNKASGKQTVGFDALLEVAFTPGWIDVQTRNVDADRYAIRFTPRKLKSNWSARNRAIVRRLLAEHRMHPEGIAALPPDLDDQASEG